MAGELRTRNAVLLVKLGTGDAAPDATNAILVEEVNAPVGVRQIENGEITGRLDSAMPQAVGAPTRWTFRTRLRGVTGAFSAGNLPPVAPLLQACSMSQTLIAAVVAAALTAGTATSGTLGAAFAATAGVYNGLPLVFSAGPNSGKSPAIIDYSAGKVATFAETLAPVPGVTDTAGIPSCVQYVPVAVALPVTLYRYLDGTLRKLFDCVGTVQLSSEAGGITVANFDMVGTFGGETDAALPAGVNANGINAPLFAQGTQVTPAFLFDGKKVGLSQFTYDAGVQLTSPDDANTQYGFAGGVNVRRAQRYTVDPNKRLVVTQNIINDLFQGREFSMVARMEGTVGNRILIVDPKVRIIGEEEGDKDGIAKERLQLGSLAGPTITFF
jgi:hypothetical protein